MADTCIAASTLNVAFSENGPSQAESELYGVVVGLGCKARHCGEQDGCAVETLETIKAEEVAA